MPVSNVGTASFNVRNCQFPRAELTVSPIVTVWNSILDRVGDLYPAHKRGYRVDENFLRGKIVAMSFFTIRIVVC